MEINRKLNFFKTTFMKLVKISIVALSMGLFLASCGGNSSEATPATDSAATVAPAVEETPAPAVTTDSTAVAPATTDSTVAPAATPAPAAH
ncbi:hypothetical protein GCM10023092_08700 [Rurimicrobium arvi]|uniref:Uncharacterized protein n=1 Tax=Rurimicrobium arvi TaxID=2049916 RepID=A0ABP8MLC5_9BACT